MWVAAAEDQSSEASGIDDSSVVQTAPQQRPLRLIHEYEYPLLLGFAPVVTVASKAVDVSDKGHHCLRLHRASCNACP
uniref:Uncharacterized protein n=1 Tax=Panagrellus redivivus TaxID=6233 RepID=A0A7E4W9X8_PANRE